MSGRFFILKTREAWADQAREALDRIEAANGGQAIPTLRDAHGIDPEAFTELIQALVSLGADVDDEMIDLAGLRDINEVI